MKVGLSLGYAGAKMALPVEKVIRAEQLGFEYVTCAETYSSDAITPLAYLGALTKRIKLGTSIAILAARSPANLAMCAQTIDAMCGEGRVFIGIGTSGPQVAEGWYGAPWGKPNYRIRDYVAIMKKVLRREGPVTHDGKEISLPYRGPGSSGLGKPLKSILHGNPDIPLLLGTDTDLNIRMTGEVADGWICMNWVPGKTDTIYKKIIGEGIARRSDGRTLSDFLIQAPIDVKVTNDVQAGIDAAKPHIALYVGGMGAKEKNFHVEKMIRRGFPDAARRIQELFLAGRKDEAAKAVPDEFVDEGAFIGPPERIRERYRKFADSGLTRMSMTNVTDQSMEVMSSFMERAA
jgi:F420-dependent oxidoreductase-like protein